LKRTEYEDLARRGAFAEERVELLRGVIVRMSPPSPRHAYAVNRLVKLLVMALGDRAIVQPQGAIAATDDSMPEPDVAVLPPDDFRNAFPVTAFLAIEVSHTSLAIDRGLKSRIYAEAGVREYWIVNLKDEVIEVHRRPRRGKYGRLTKHGRGEAIKLEAFPEVRIEVASILP
jgi:Uma2 family endonuclease